MAAFRQHLTVSSCLGVGYAAALCWLGLGWVHSALAGLLCGVAGMLPDLDSDSGRPARELFGVTAVAVPLLLVHRWQRAGISPEGAVLLGAVLYLAIRFGLAWLFHRLTVHRGMWHSLPAAVIAAEVVFLADHGPVTARFTLAGGVLIGFLSHLVLDELYSVDARGFKVRLNKAAGSALKLASRSTSATLVAWSILAALTYLAGVEQGYLRPIHWSVDFPAVGGHAGLTGLPGSAESSSLPARP